jgi:hypothetical protein
MNNNSDTSSQVQLEALVSALDEVAKRGRRLRLAGAVGGEQ